MSPKVAFLFSLLLSVAYGAPHILSNKPQLDGRIVGGWDVNIEEVNYQCSLVYFGSHRCGCAIISSNFVLTAAHCTAGISASSLSIRAGSTYRNSGGVVIQLSAINQHPSYNSATIDYDVSVSQLSSQLSFGSAIGTAKLPALNDPVPYGHESMITGWGALTEGGTSPNVLQAVVVPIVTQEVCRNAYGQSAISDRMLCAGNLPQGGRDACQGDSGGPLVVDGTLYGIVSWGYGCARPNFPGVYSSVPGLRQYIQTISGI